MAEVKKKLLLVDGHSLIHRAYHAFPATLSTASGEQTNAVYGFTRMLLEAIHDLKPTHVAVAFDLPGPTFRETMFVGYKRSRVKPDDAMVAQIPRVKEVVQTLGIPMFEVAGFEADDVIGTLCRQAKEQLSVFGSRLSDIRQSVVSSSVSEPDKLKTDKHGTENRKQKTDNRVIILTSDRDLMQLIRGDRVMVKMPERGKKREAARLPARQGSVKREAMNYELRTTNDLWNEKRFIDHWGFRPALFPDYKAFAGDASDDIPGVRGIGEKTGKGLISQFGSVNDVYRVITQKSKVKSQKYNSKLKSFSERIIRQLAEDQDSAQMSKKLATIDTDVPIKLDWKAMEVHGYDKEKALKLFDELQFKSLIPKLPNDSFEESVQDVLF